jgi:hypothetical protein
MRLAQNSLRQAVATVLRRQVKINSLKKGIAKHKSQGRNDADA